MNKPQKTLREIEIQENKFLVKFQLRKDKKMACNEKKSVKKPMVKGKKK